MIKPQKGDDGQWFLEGAEGLDVLRGPYRTRLAAVRALKDARRAKEARRAAGRSPTVRWPPLSADAEQPHSDADPGL